MLATLCETNKDNVRITKKQRTLRRNLTDDSSHYYYYLFGCPSNESMENSWWQSQRTLGWKWYYCDCPLFHASINQIVELGHSCKCTRKVIILVFALGDHQQITSPTFTLLFSLVTSASGVSHISSGNPSSTFTPRFFSPFRVLKVVLSSEKKLFQSLKNVIYQ